MISAVRRLTEGGLDSQRTHAFAELLFSLCLLIGCFTITISAFRLPTGATSASVGPGGWPRVVCVALMVLTIVYVIQCTYKVLRFDRTAGQSELDDDPEGHALTRRGLVKLGLLALIQLSYVTIFTSTSFTVTTSLMLFLSMVVLGRPYPRAIIESVVGAILLYVVFAHGLGVHLPNAGLWIL